MNEPIKKMSDIQRYGLRIIDRRAVIATDDSGWYYLADDVDEALRQAREDERLTMEAPQLYYGKGYSSGQRDALRQAVQRVEALVEVQHADFVGYYVNTEAVKRAIKGDSDE
jgi:hypothetical protein